MKKIIVIISLFLASHSLLAQFNFSIGGGVSFSDEGFAPTLVFEPKIQISNMARFGIGSRVGLDSEFRSIYGDLNFKLSEKNDFYIGLGAGPTTYEGIDNVGYITPNGGFKGNTTETKSGLAFIPSIGFQGKTDVNLSAFIIGEVMHLSFTISKVIGYKEKAGE